MIYYKVILFHQCACNLPSSLILHPLFAQTISGIFSRNSKFSGKDIEEEILNVCLVSLGIFLLTFPFGFRCYFLGYCYQQNRTPTNTVSYKLILIRNSIFIYEHCKPDKSQVLSLYVNVQILQFKMSITYLFSLPTGPHF